MNNSFLDYINSIIGFNFYKNTIDHFSLIKWIPIIILGIFIGRIIHYYNLPSVDTSIKKTSTQSKKSHNSKKIIKNLRKNVKKKQNNTNIDILSWIGKNTLLLYIIHIPIIIFSIKYYFKLN